MSRHPGLQHQARLRELADLVAEMHCSIMGHQHDKQILERQVIDAGNDLERAKARLKPIYELMIKVAGAESINDYGLPTGITAETYREVTGKILGNAV